MNETLRRSSLGELARGRRGEPRAAAARRRPARRPRRAGPRRRRRRRCGESREDGFARVVTIDAPPELLRYVVEKGSIAVDGVSLTVAGARRRLVLGLADPRDAGAHDAGHGRAGRPRQPGGGRARQVRGEAGAPDEPQQPFATIEEAIEDIRAGQHGRRLRRRGPRERGRPRRWPPSSPRPRRSTSWPRRGAG